jgi:hypothetical protein
VISLDSTGGEPDGEAGEEEGDEDGEDKAVGLFDLLLTSDDGVLCGLHLGVDHTNG